MSNRTLAKLFEARRLIEPSAAATMHIVEVEAWFRRPPEEQDGARKDAVRGGLRDTGKGAPDT